MNCLLAGASGLIGSQLLNELISDTIHTEITILVRKEIECKSSKVKQIIFDFEDVSSYQKLTSFDVVFCCLGTTIKIAKTKENFRKVDFSYPLLLAKNVRTICYSLVSSMGANSQSSIFYSKTKGELEDELKKLNFTSLLIFRPSQLTGDRTIKRRNEWFSEKLMNLFSFTIPKNYQLIKAKTVAKAMRISSKKINKGNQTFLSNEIKQIVLNENK